MTPKQRLPILLKPTKRNLILILAAVVIGSMGSYIFLLNKGTGAYVNGERIYLAPINKRIEALKARDPNRFRADNGEEERIRRALIEERIDSKLIAQGALKEGVRVTDAEVDNRIRRMKKSYKSATDYRKQLKAEGYSESMFRDLIKDQLLGEKLRIKLAKEVKVRPEEIRAYMKFNKDKFKRAMPQVKLGIINTASAKIAKELAESLRHGMFWSKAGKTYGVGGTTQDLGWQLEKFLRPDVVKLLAPLKKGDFTRKAAANPDGTFSVFRLIDRKVRKSKPEEIPHQAAAKVAQDKQIVGFRRWFKKLKKKADIQIKI